MVDAGLVSLLNKMVRYHFKDRYQSATEASAATTSRALLANTASCSSTITNRYSTASCPKAWAGQYANSTSSAQLGSHTNDPAVPNKSALLIGIAAGVVSALALMVVSYYSLQPPVPASKFQRYPVSAPSKKIPLSENSLANTEGHSDTVWSVAISPDSQTLFSSRRPDDQTLESQHWRTASHSLWAFRSGLRPESGWADPPVVVHNTIKIWNLSRELPGPSLGIQTRLGLLPCPMGRSLPVAKRRHD